MISRVEKILLNWLQGLFYIKVSCAGQTFTIIHVCIIYFLKKTKLTFNSCTMNDNFTVRTHTKLILFILDLWINYTLIKNNKIVINHGLINCILFLNRTVERERTMPNQQPVLSDMTKIVILQILFRNKICQKGQNYCNLINTLKLTVMSFFFTANQQKLKHRFVSWVHICILSKA